MSLHQTIKNQIKEALRAKDTIRLDTLRGLNALFQNELLTSTPRPLGDRSVPSFGSAKVATLLPPATAADDSNFLSDDKVLAIVKRSVKQRKDSIEQFTKGGRNDLAEKEKTELAILESFLPTLMPREQVVIIVKERIDAMKAQGTFDAKAGGKIVGTIMKELSGKADGADVKAAVEAMLK